MSGRGERAPSSSTKTSAISVRDGFQLFLVRGPLLSTILHLKAIAIILAKNKNSTGLAQRQDSAGPRSKSPRVLTPPGILARVAEEIALRRSLTSVARRLRHLLGPRSFRLSKPSSCFRLSSLTSQVQVHSPTESHLPARSVLWLI